MSRRVVVTGMGAVSPVGLNVAETWQNLIAGKSGIGPITQFDASEMPCRIAGEVKNFDPTGVIEAKDLKKMDRFIQLGMAATAEALKQAGLDNITDESLSDQFGVALGSGVGGLKTIEEGVLTLKERGPRRISPFFIPAILVNLLPGQVSMKWQLRGPNLSHVSACATGAHAIGEAAETIRRGDAIAMVAGGAEAGITAIAFAGFSAARTLSTGYNDTPEKASRPFDKDRDGFVMGEGAAVLVLEEYEHAKKRGATILAEVAGYGASGDGYHLTSPSPDGSGAKRAMGMALRKSGLKPEDVGYVNAHATSTPAGDEIESQAIASVFGDKVLISATKSMTGHLLGAAGSLECVIAIQALREGVVPPTLNLENPSDSCTLDYVPHKARKVELKATVSNSFGFGGTNAALLFTKGA